MMAGLVPAAVLGQQSDGSFGLRCSLPPYNALTDDFNDSDKFSFCSDWPDLIKTHQIGIATAPATVYFADLGYIPHMEIRQASSPLVYDDRPHLIQTYMPSTYIAWYRNDWSHGLAVAIQRAQFSVAAREAGSVFYIVFKESSS